MHSQTCRFCGRKLGLLERWRHQHYCSAECKASFEKENARLAVEWLSELNRTRKPATPPPAPKESEPEDFPEPAEPGFVPQPEPVGNDQPIRVLGFPAAKPMKASKRKEESGGLGDRIPSRIAMANEVKRIGRALWVNVESDAAEGPDSYRTDGRYAIYAPEIHLDESVLALPVAECEALDVTAEVRDFPAASIAFAADAFDWKFSSKKPGRRVPLAEPELKAGCCELPIVAAPPEPAEIERGEIEMSWPPPCEAELPGLSLALAAIDFRTGRQKPKPFVPAAPESAASYPHPPQPAVSQSYPGTPYPQPYAAPVQPYPAPFYPAYPTPVYPVGYPVVTVPAHSPPAADTLIHALMSATATRTAGQATGAFDATAITSILPALLASGWLRIEPDFAHLLPEEVETPEADDPAWVLPAIEALSPEAAMPARPRLAAEWSSTLTDTSLEQLEPCFCDIPVKARDGEDAVPMIGQAIRPNHAVLVATELRPTELMGIGTASYEPDSDVRTVPAEPECEPLKALRPEARLQPGKPGWRPRDIAVRIPLRPHDLSFLDIPMEAGPWARE